MKVKNMIWLFVIAGLSLFGYLTATSQHPANSFYNSSSFISASHIYNDEVRDTTWAMERGTSLSLPDVFRYILPIQTIGRTGLEYDPYLLKCQEFLDTLRILRDYIGDVKRDTVFIVEKISKAQDYYIEVLREPDSILRLTDTGLWSLTKKQKLLRQRENSYIINWNKNLLQEYGCCEQIEGYYRSNTTSRCVTRLIITPDSIYLDMIKYYNPFWPKDKK